MRYRYFTAIPDAAGRLLMLRQGDSWILPCNEPDAFHPWQEVYHEHEALTEALHLDAVTLRLVWVDFDESKDRVLYLYASVMRTSDWAPPEYAHWHAATDLDSVPLSEPDLRAGLLAWRTWVASPVDKPLPWSDAAWYTSTFAREFSNR